MTNAMTDQEKAELVARTIDQLCKEHGLAAMYFISALTHGTHALRFETAPWFRVESVENDDGSFRGFHVKSKLTQYQERGMAEADALAQQKADIEYTINALGLFGVQGGQASMIALEMLKHLSQRFDAKTTSERVGDASGKKPS